METWDLADRNRQTGRLACAFRPQHLTPKPVRSLSVISEMQQTKSRQQGIAVCWTYMIAWESERVYFITYLYSKSPDFLSWLIRRVKLSVHTVILVSLKPMHYDKMSGLCCISVLRKKIYSILHLAYLILCMPDVWHYSLRPSTTFLWMKTFSHIEWTMDMNTAD